jgi:chemotaxis signal transduction protein
MCASRGESFGLELKWVREIDFHPRVLPLPTAQPPLVGLIGWRGGQVPVLSLDQLLGHKSSAESQSVLMLEIEGQALGMLVEEVGQSLAIDSQEIFSIDQSLAGREGLVTQAVRTGDDLVFKLNIERLILSGLSTADGGLLSLSSN